MTYFMGSDTAFLARKVVNDTQQARFYDVSVEESDPPYGGAVERKAPAGELLYAPRQLLLRPNSSNWLKLYYHGPQDEHPRYYRITFRERPGALVSQGDTPRFTTSVRLSTILVVQPRQARQSYTIENGAILNSGNTVYLAYLEGRCPAELGVNVPCVREKYLVPDERLSLQGWHPTTDTRLFMSNEQTQSVQWR
ncbi:hypothetical protein [Chromobacterium haemolyticum]|uniref:hypothetical protein n=1 Tax=Chromobacterium TaxID=535 RepID=UPI00405721F6